MIDATGPNDGTGYIVTGTDTGIGKTVFAAALTRALDGCYWKPIQSGLDGETDSDAVARLSGLPRARVIPEIYRLSRPLSPHRAAELDSVTIEAARLVPPASKRPLIIEGAGGLLVPVTRDMLQIDLFATYARPLILCATTALGTINHTLLSVEAIRARDLPLAGIAFIGEENPDTEATICDFAQSPPLGSLPRLAPLTPQTLEAAFAAGFPTFCTRSAMEHTA